MPTFQLGEIRVDRIVDWDGPFLTALQFFPDATREALESHLDWLAPGALSVDELRMNLPVQSYLVRSGSTACSSTAASAVASRTTCSAAGASATTKSGSPTCAQPAWRLRISTP